MIRLTYLNEARTRPDKLSYSEILDQYLKILKFLNEDIMTNFPKIGQSFVIESLKIIRYEVYNDQKQVILKILLDLLDNYVNLLNFVGFQKFSQQLVDPKVVMLLEILDCSMFLSKFLFKRN